LAVFGVDFYGLSKYGSRLLVDFGVDPFTAEAINYDQIKVEWQQPTGNWTGFRLLRSGHGFAVNEVDGELLLEYTANVDTHGTYTDNEPRPGWNYYTIYLYDATNNEWAKVAQTSALRVNDHGFRSKLWGVIPEYYKTLRDNTAGFNPDNYAANPAIYLSHEGSVENIQLRKFVEVLGWGFDISQTQIETCLVSMDPANMHLGRLDLLSYEFGMRTEQSAPTYTTRNMVRNLGLLYRKRGTPIGIKELLALAVGWEVDVVFGPNKMLNRDQSAFESPVVETWDRGATYQIGDLVQFGGVYFRAVQINMNVSPPVLGNNPYWNQISTVEENIDNKRTLVTNNHSTWMAVAQSPKTPLVANTSTFIGRGVTKYDDPTHQTNALGFKNTTGVTKDIVIQSVPYNINDLANYDKQLLVESALPVPSAHQIWDAATKYLIGEKVTHNGIVYVAIVNSQGVDPATTTFWNQLGYDDRVRISFSFYAHGPFTAPGAGGAGGRNVTPWIGGYDDQGNVVWELPLTGTLRTNVNFDTFNKTGVLAAAKAMDFGPSTWTAVAGTWIQGFSDSYGGYQYPGTGKTWAVSNVGFADGKIAVTLPVVGTRKIGLMLRQTDASNYIRVDQTQIVRVTAGAETVLATHSTAFSAGDRMTVTLLGTAITVQRNAQQVSTATSSQNQTTTRHGVVVEA
jgi:hypothetical protein